MLSLYSNLSWLISWSKINFHPAWNAFPVLKSFLINFLIQDIFSPGPKCVLCTQIFLNWFLDPRFIFTRLEMLSLYLTLSKKSWSTTAFDFHLTLQNSIFHLAHRMPCSQLFQRNPTYISISWYWLPLLLKIVTSA